MHPDKSKTTIGSILAEYNIVAPQDLTRADKLSKLCGLPIGKCLVLLDCITEVELRAFLEAQSLIRDGVFEPELIAAALDIVRRKKWPLADALLSYGCDAHLTRRTRLGELLSDACAISDFQLSFALKAADFSCIPLGKVLTSFNRFDNTLIDSALQLQSEVRRGRTERSSAVSVLTDLTQRLCPSAIKADSHFRLGELLCNAQVLSSSALETALKAAASKKKLIGEYLVESETVSEPTLLATLCIQNLLDAQLITHTYACDLLKRVGDLSPVAATSANRISLFDFLRAAGYLTTEKRQHLMISMASNAENNISEIKRQLDDNVAFHKILLSAFPTDSMIINSGMVLHQLVLTDKLTVSQALLAFCCRQGHIDVASLQH